MVFFLWALAAVPVPLPGWGQEDSCPRPAQPITRSDFPAVLTFQVRKLTMAIGSVPPFPGGDGAIRVVAGPVVNGVAPFSIRPTDFKIAPFVFPYFFSWTTVLDATGEGRGELRLASAGRTASLSLQIPVEAANRVGSIRLRSNFVTGRSPPATIAGQVYRSEGRSWDLATGGAVLVATGKTEAESHPWFRNVDFYSRSELCIGLAREETPATPRP
jgi:hypothetical protein